MLKSNHRIALPVCLSAVLGMATASVQAEPNVRPGLWETTITSSIPGLPTAPPMSHQSCITADDLVPRDDKHSEHCSRLDHKLDGDTVTWTVECNQNGMQTSGKGRITYVGDTFDGVIDMEMSGGPGGSMKITQLLQGRRIGDCE